MKIAITSTGNSPASTLDQRFGRCSWFVIYDTESGATEFIPNQHKNDEEGAGPAAVQLIASRKVTKIISGEFGEKVKSQLDSMRVQLIILKNPEITIDNIIKLLSH